MARRRNPAVVWFLSTLCITFGRLTERMPLALARALGRQAGRAAYYVIPRVRRVALANLDLAYGDSLPSREKRRIAMGAAENVGIVAAEFSRMRTMDREAALAHVTVRGLEDGTQGGFIISAHLGNWEWMATAITALGCSVAEVVRPLDDPRLNAYVDGVRSANGVRTVDKEGSGTEIMRLLRQGWLVGVLVDQSPREAAVPVTFFGQPCWATVAPAMVALRARAPIRVVTMVRDHQGHYTLTFSAPIELTRSGNLRRDLIDITQRCQDAIEAEVRRHPEQWLWLHRRWKARPRLDAEWKAKVEKERGE